MSSPTPTLDRPFRRIIAAAAATAVLTFTGAAFIGVGIVASSPPALAHGGDFAHEGPNRTPAGPPQSSTSRYMSTVDESRLYGLGCLDGRAIYLGVQPLDSLVILDFGMPVQRGQRFGASLFEDFVATHRIRRATVAYAQGWLSCIGERTPAHLELAIGTSNYGSEVTYQHGRAWAHMVNRADAVIREAGADPWVRITGANDIETGWAGPSDSKAWVKGYASEALLPYYNYGAAGGCPPYGTCNGGWSVDDVWFVAWGMGKGLMVPEIYANSGANAEQWYQLSLYGALEHGKPIRFAGVMTQLASCIDVSDPCEGVSNSPSEGWQQLWHALNADSRTASGLRFLTDISWRN